MRIKDKLSRFTHCIRAVQALFLFVFLTGSYPGFTQAPRSRVDQLSDEDVKNFFQRAQASGLSEAQIEQAAMSQGYTLDDITKMRRRIAAIRSGSTQPTSQTGVQPANGRTLPTDLSTRPDSLLITRRDTTRRLRVFGASYRDG